MKFFRYMYDSAAEANGHILSSLVQKLQEKRYYSVQDTAPYGDSGGVVDGVRLWNLCAGELGTKKYYHEYLCEFDSESEPTKEVIDLLADMALIYYERLLREHKEGNKT